MNAAASAVGVGGTSDASTEKEGGDLVTLVDGAVAGFDNNDAADDDLVTFEAGGGLATVVSDLEIVEPAGKLAMAEPADDLVTVGRCGSSSEREKEADVLANGSHVLENVDDALVSVVVKVAGGDLASVFAINSGSAWTGSSLTWTSLCQICPLRRHCWASWGYNRTHGCGNKWS